MCRRGTGRIAGHRVVRPLATNHAALRADVQRAADDGDRLLQGIGRLRRGAMGTAHARHRIPEVAGAEPQLEATAAHHVQRRGGLGQHRGPAHRQGSDIREEAQARGARQQVGDQGEGVEVAPLVRVVLDADQLQAVRLPEQHVVHDLRVRGSHRHHRHAEDRAPVGPLRTHACILATSVVLMTTESCPAPDAHANRSWTAALTLKMPA